MSVQQTKNFLIRESANPVSPSESSPSVSQRLGLNYKYAKERRRMNRTHRLAFKGYGSGYARDPHLVSIILGLIELLYN